MGPTSRLVIQDENDWTGRVGEQAGSSGNASQSLPFLLVVVINVYWPEWLYREKAAGHFITSQVCNKYIPSSVIKKRAIKFETSLKYA